MLIRPAEIADAEAIRSIYNTEVTTSTHVFELVPHTLDQQRRWIEDRSGAHAAVVAVDDGVVIGFGALSPYRPRPAVQHHGRGFGVRPSGSPGGGRRQSTAHRTGRPGHGPRVPLDDRQDRRPQRRLDRPAPVPRFRRGRHRARGRPEVPPLDRRPGHAAVVGSVRNGGPGRI